MSFEIICGDALQVLAGMASDSVHCVVTSPPYWGLRDYKIEPSVWGGDPMCTHEWGGCGTRRNGRAWDPTLGASPVGRDTHGTTGQFCSRCSAWRGALGLEPTPELFVTHLVEVFRAVRRVLRKDGTLWLNLGDCYATGAGKVGACPGGGEQGARFKEDYFGGHRGSRGGSSKQPHTGSGVGPLTQPNRLPIPGLKPKDLVGVPWRVAFALQSDGWWLRSDIIWHKPNPMPESVTDRPTKAHEYIFLLSKSEKYYYDAEAIKESLTGGLAGGRQRAEARGEQASTGKAYHPGRNKALSAGKGPYANFGSTRNRRSVWTIATYPVKDAHFATYPPDLIEPCILAGCPEGGTVLDPFAGSGTTGLVAIRHGRRFLGIELNPAYIEIAHKRMREKFGRWSYGDASPPARRGRRAREVTPTNTHIYRWGPRGKMPGAMSRKGQECRVLARGGMNSALIEFRDGYLAVVSRNALRVVPAHMLPASAPRAEGV